MFRFQELDKNLKALGKQYAAVTAEKQKCQAEADATAKTVDLANRLISGLKSESVSLSTTQQNYFDTRNQFFYKWNCSRSDNQPINFDVNLRFCDSRITSFLCYYILFTNLL